MEQKIKIKCPHCGWIRKLDIKVYKTAAQATVVSGPVDDIKKAVESMRQKFSSSSLNEANAWLDMTCPKCKKTYQYNTITHEVKA